MSVENYPATTKLRPKDLASENPFISIHELDEHAIREMAAKSGGSLFKRTLSYRNGIINLENHPIHVEIKIEDKAQKTNLLGCSYRFDDNGLLIVAPVIKVDGEIEDSPSQLRLLRFSKNKASVLQTEITEQPEDIQKAAQDAFEARMFWLRQYNMD